MKTAVVSKDLTHAYGDLIVLKGLSFSVPLGDFFIVIGPNGSGKSTLMKTLSGIEKSMKGRVEILGRSIQSYSRKALARIMAYVPQMAPVDFPFTVKEVVLMGRAPHLGILGFEQERDFEIAAQAMSFTGVEDLQNRRMDQLSGGEIQRVFIARAICQEPRIVVLDEPTASLDLAHQVRIMDLMERLKEEKAVTVVMVSHDVNLAAMYGDHLLLIKEGEVVSLGTPSEVLRYDILEEAYGCRLLVDESPLGGAQRVTLVPGRFMDGDPPGPDQ
ncbi:MAG: ABC transporter ATP-binding protein [Desulfatiglans sp.]|jgi:iron complex transport system ATP-binding protein|nr:ABC transporter ATP-binding protein [Desulfatiglans sp.]